MKDENNSGRSLIEQISDKPTYSKLTYESLHKVVEDALFGQHAIESKSFLMSTGRGGIKDAIKAHCEVFGSEYNLKNFIAMYKFLVRTGSLVVTIDKKRGYCIGTFKS